MNQSLLRSQRGGTELSPQLHAKLVSAYNAFSPASRAVWRVGATGEKE
jgi:hypothetical protein